LEEKRASNTRTEWGSKEHMREIDFDPRELTLQNIREIGDLLMKLTETMNTGKGA
jgi:hypothetical protein